MAYHMEDPGYRTWLGPHHRRVGPSDVAWVAALKGSLPRGHLSRLDADQDLYWRWRDLDLPDGCVPAWLPRAIVADPKGAANTLIEFLASRTPLSLRHLMGDRASAAPLEPDAAACLVGLNALAAAVGSGERWLHASPSDLAALVLEMLAWPRSAWSGLPDAARASFLDIAAHFGILRKKRDWGQLLSALADEPSEILGIVVQAWAWRRGEGRGDTVPIQGRELEVIEAVLSQGRQLAASDYGGGLLGQVWIPNRAHFVWDDLPLLARLTGIGVRLPEEISAALVLARPPCANDAFLPSWDIGRAKDCILEPLGHDSRRLVALATRPRAPG